MKRMERSRIRKMDWKMGIGKVKMVLGFFNYYSSVLFSHTPLRRRQESP